MNHINTNDNVSQMVQSKNNLLFLIGLLFALAIGIYGTHWWYTKNTPARTEESVLLLEHIKNVTKLVTVEGYFSEVYTETDSKEYYYFFSSTKKALIKVKAKVSAGYDLSNMVVNADQATKTLHISNISEPKIIAIEPEISYYDIANGVFNQFTSEDYTRLNKKAVDTIRTQVVNSDFMNAVKTQGSKNFGSIRVLAQSMGWSVVFDKNDGLPLR